MSEKSKKVLTVFGVFVLQVVAVVGSFFWLSVLSWNISNETTVHYIVEYTPLVLSIFAPIVWAAIFRHYLVKSIAISFMLILVLFAGLYLYLYLHLF